jgi:chemotaxis protein methyltransferase CheR
VPFFIGPVGPASKRPTSHPRNPTAAARDGRLPWRLDPRPLSHTHMAFTFFFRDSQTLELALDQALPSLGGRAFIHVWDAGCAHGPEPYTLAILLRERMSDYIFRNVRIHASDIDSSFAPKVTEGIFAEPEVRRVPAEIGRKYFRPAAAPGQVEIVAELRAKVGFLHHDLLSLRPIREGLSLIVCKNVLLHFDEAQRVGVLRMFHQALQPGGTLVLEHTQKLPGVLAGLFQQVVPHAQVFRKVERALVEPQADPTGPHSLGRRRVDAVEDEPQRQHPDCQSVRRQSARNDVEHS